MAHLEDLNLKWRNDKQCNTKNHVTRDLCIQMIKKCFQIFHNHCFVSKYYKRILQKKIRPNWAHETA